MTIIDTSEIPDGTEVDADICIVGAGAAGITLACQLAKGSKHVCLLESGRMKLEEEVQSLYDLESTGHPVRENYMSRVRCFGGSTTLWAGRAMRMSPIDFLRRDWVPHSGWPIAAEDLRPYETATEEILGLPSFLRFDRLNDLPEIAVSERALLEAAALDHSTILWGTKPRRFGTAFRKTLNKSRKVATYIGGTATDIQMDETRSRVRCLKARTMSGRVFSIKAHDYVLASGGLENARLLLVNDVGNQHDKVGRFYLDHPRMIFGRVRLNEPLYLPYLLGLPLADGKVQLGIGLSEQVQRKECLLNSYLSLEPQLSRFAEEQYGRTANAAKILLRRGHAGGRLQFGVSMTDAREIVYLLTPKEVLPHFLYRYYAMMKRLARRRVSGRYLTVINYCEQAPRPESRVTLGADRDALGVSRLRLDWRMGGAELESLRRLHEILHQNLEKANVGTLETSFWNAEPPGFTDASHHIGTARMSTRPEDGVVDADCRVHGVENLFVAGSAVFPTAGHANPTFTIVALALRLADHLQARKQNIES